ncbi:hypothetical protein M422DRAFT_267874 [Sphaerobolus stellatus SS14]|uniref:Uncharacterized protein n=1 Tax=Sphaerobolus stellatus (strain SS14) TaxID=990650 RepID=A0A0C9UNT3_SPHS4|nr:hypothetical protein M422DRAFT_267874 [Sphaerobolus stellatus SS14]
MEDNEAGRQDNHTPQLRSLCTADLCPQLEQLLQLLQEREGPLLGLSHSSHLGYIVDYFTSKTNTSQLPAESPSSSPPSTTPILVTPFTPKLNNKKLNIRFR